ncbi:unnamed protein product [Prorocentrum cordatum]|uniref:Uncharacterized protein n=1 Tax=Prorocentrum cordatum TaxID=2364126 RepID=A0ABN9Y405_9DINO|nr:unnamed protein product [Polarella glacialis]
MSRGRGDLYKLALGPEAVRAALAWPGRHTHRPTGPEVGLRGGGCLKISPPDSYLPGLGENDKAAKASHAQGSDTQKTLHFTLRQYLSLRLRGHWRGRRKNTWLALVISLRCTKTMRKKKTTSNNCAACVRCKTSAGS